MHGKLQPGGRPQITNYGQIFIHLWTEVHQIVHTSTRVVVVCNVISHSGDIHIKSSESVQKFLCFLGAVKL